MYFIFEQIKMRYIAQKKSDSPCTRCAKSDKTLKYMLQDQAP